MNDKQKLLMNTGFNQLLIEKRALELIPTFLKSSVTPHGGSFVIVIHTTTPSLNHPNWSVLKNYCEALFGSYPISFKGNHSKVNTYSRFYTNFLKNQVNETKEVPFNFINKASFQLKKMLQNNPHILGGLIRIKGKRGTRKTVKIIKMGNMKYTLAKTDVTKDQVKTTRGVYGLVTKLYLGQK